MNRTKLIVFVLILVTSFTVIAQKNDVREIFTNDRMMKTVNLTLGRSTILSFTDKPVKVVTGNSNYFNVEYIGNDLTIQPLANVDTNLFVYTQNKMKYGFHLKVGAISAYDDMIYIRWKSSFQLDQGRPRPNNEKPQRPFKILTLKVGQLEVVINKLIRLKGTKTYLVDFEAKNKGGSEVKLKEVDIFLSKSNERMKGQKLFFEKESLPMHDTSRGRIFLPLERPEDFSFYLSFQKKTNKVVISKIYL